ncbi:MAG: LysM peptidoglycan-binding domain-containing protein [Deferrisomatales bacterium]|nr:LysM peptidoglycan-binding domain-containing protein [Deferrisomatales bacterium]
MPLCIGAALLVAIGSIGCASTAQRPRGEPARYSPGVAAPPPQAAAAEAPLHRPQPLTDMGTDLTGKGAEGMPACPMFDPFSAEERLHRALQPLMLGNEEQGRRELLLALCQEPDDPTARDLLRQLDVAPETELGKKFVAYRVQSGDSLPAIAKRLLGDPYRFYVLARYNRLSRPGEITVGQCLRVPSEPPGDRARAAGELATCGETTERMGDPTLAYAYFARGVEIDPDNGASRAGLSRVAEGAAEVYRRNAVRALREQDVAAACWNSRKALEIRPDSTEMVSLRDTALEIGQSLANALYREALAAHARGDRDEALANCGRVLELDPDHAGADKLLQLAAGMPPNTR